MFCSLEGEKKSRIGGVKVSRSKKSCIAFLLCYIEGMSTAFDRESLGASSYEKQLFFSKLGQSAVRA